MGLFSMGKKELGERQAVADQLGLTFVAKDPFDIGPTDHFLLPSGAPAGALNVFHGDRGGGPIRLFDYLALGAPDPLYRLAGFPGTGAKKTQLTAGIAELPRPVTSTVVITPTAMRQTSPHVAPTGDDRLDEALVCVTRDAELARALADPDVAGVLLEAPPDCAVELTAQDLLVVCDRRPLERLVGLADYLVRLRDALPATVFTT